MEMNFRTMTDDEIGEECHQISRRCRGDKEAEAEIYKWLGYRPSVSSISRGSMKLTNGMVFSPNTDEIISF